MSCKYCELKRRKDDGVEWLAGEDWESDSDDGGYICPNDDGFRMLVYYDARCACTAVDNIKYCPFCGAKLAMPKEPLIKDEKIRKAVRAWADANDIEDGITYLGDGEFRSYLNTTIDFAILVDEHRFDLLKKSEEYTITELCGEEKE